jgi:hypothetical protein
MADNIIYGCDFKYKIKPKPKKQRELEELATRIFYESIGVTQTDNPKEPA